MCFVVAAWVKCSPVLFCVGKVGCGTVLFCTGKVKSGMVLYGTVIVWRCGVGFRAV